MFYSPSAHQSFMAHEEHHRTQYEVAEAAGRDGADCAQVYPECSSSLLDYFTSFEDHHHHHHHYDYDDADNNDSINGIESLKWVGVISDKMK